MRDSVHCTEKRKRGKVVKDKTDGGTKNTFGIVEHHYNEVTLRAEMLPVIQCSQKKVAVHEQNRTAIKSVNAALNCG